MTIQIKAAADNSKTNGPDYVRLRATAPAEIQAASDEKKLPTFSIVGYTGAPMNVQDFFYPVILDMAGLKAASQTIPTLRGHDPDRIVGQTDSVKISDQATFTGTITGENDDAHEVVTQAKNGFKWQASVGASVDRREFLDVGKTAKVNGREVSGPMIIVRQGTIKEISFVPLGADSSTTANVAATLPLELPKGANVDFEKWLQAKGFDPAAISDGQKASLKLFYDAEHKPTPMPTTVAPATQSLDEVLAAQRSEGKRVADITAISARWIVERPSQIDDVERIGRAAIEAKGTTPDQFELLLVRELRPPPFAVHARSSSPELNGQVIEAAVCRTLGLRDIEKSYDGKTLEASHRTHKHGIGFQELLLTAARANGFHALSARDTEGMLRAAFSREVRAAGYSTLSIPGILSNVANKFLIQAFNAVEQGWRQISAVQNVNDFKTISSYSLTGDMQYEKVGPGGQLHHATLGQAAYTNQALTYGKIIAITRTDIVNDNLGALAQVPARLGRGAALKLNDVFWTEFLNVRDTFWATANNNLSSGAGSALSSAGLKAAQQIFRKQTDPNGKPLGISPKFLVVPPELEITADELMTSTAVNTGGSSTTDKVPNRNIWASKFTTVLSTYLSNASYANESTTHWFLLADPLDLATIQVAFLDGRETPIIDSADADFDTLGIKMRGVHDFGVSKQEPRASVRSAGA